MTDDEARQLDVFADLAELAIDRCNREYRRVAGLMEDREQRVLLAMILAAEFILYAQKLGISEAHVLEAVTGIVGRSR